MEENQIVFPKLLKMTEVERVLSRINDCLAADIEYEVILSKGMEYTPEHPIEHLKGCIFRGIIKSKISPHPCESFETYCEMEENENGIPVPHTRGIRFATEMTAGQYGPEARQLRQDVRKAVSEYFWKVHNIGMTETPE